MSNEELKVWAKREVELAAEQGLSTEAIASYQVALDTFINFLDNAQNLTDQLVEVAKAVLFELIHSQPLTPIQDDENEWVVSDHTFGYDPYNEREDGHAWNMYQSLRYPSLFKKVVYKKGDEKEVTYTDIDRSSAIDIWTMNCYEGGLAESILNEMYPITMPYQPSVDKIRIFTEEFAHSEGDDPDTFGILYFRLPSGELQKIDRFFKEDPETSKIVEIDSKEYHERIVKKRLNQRCGKEIKTNE